MARDKENEMLEELRNRIRKAAANKKPVEQNVPSIIEEMGGRAKIGRPKILDAFKGSEDQVKPSMMRGKMTTAEMEAKMKKKAAENKEIEATRKRARKAAEKPRTTKQVKPSWMKEIESKTGKPIGASLTVVKESVTVSPAPKKEQTSATKPGPKKKAPAKKQPTTTAKKDKFEGEPRTIAQAKRMGKNYFINKSGKKLAAVTKEELSKSGMSLREYLNKKSGKAKGGYATKNNKGANDYRMGGMLMSVQDRRKMK